MTNKTTQLVALGLAALAGFLFLLLVLVTEKTGGVRQTFSSIPFAPASSAATAVLPVTAKRLLVCVQDDGKPFYKGLVENVEWLPTRVSFQTDSGVVELHVPTQVCALTDVPPAPPPAPATTTQGK